MNKKTKRLIDIGLLAIGIGLVLFLLMAPPETTAPMPMDDNHREFYATIAKEGRAGKKVAEKFCENCHNAQGVPFPENHPPKNRCLLCHKLDDGPQ